MLNLHTKGYKIFGNYSVNHINQTSRYRRPARFVPSRVNWRLILYGLYIECTLGVITVIMGKTPNHYRIFSAGVNTNI